MQTFSRTIYNKRLKYSKSCNSRGPTASPTDHHRLHSEAVVSIDCMLPSTTRCHILSNRTSHLFTQTPHRLQQRCQKWTLFVLDFPNQWHIPLHCDWHWLFKYSDVLLFQQKHSIKISLIICRFSSYICFSHWCFHVCVFDFLHRMY